VQFFHSTTLCGRCFCDAFFIIAFFFNIIFPDANRQDKRFIDGLRALFATFPLLLPSDMTPQKLAALMVPYIIHPDRNLSDQTLSTLIRLMSASSLRPAIVTAIMYYTLNMDIRDSDFIAILLIKV